MEIHANDRRPRRPARSIRGLTLAVLLIALLLALMTQSRRAARRERRLREELQAERARAQGLHRLAHLAIDRDRLSDAEKDRLRRELDDEARRAGLRAASLRTATLGGIAP